MDKNNQYWQHVIRPSIQEGRERVILSLQQVGRELSNLSLEDPDKSLSYAHELLSAWVQAIEEVQR